MLKVEKEKVANIPLLRLTGPVDQKNIQTLEQAVLDLYENKHYRLMLDLQRVESINSSGLGLLINLAHKAHEEGGGIRLIYVDDKFKMIFDLLGLGERLLILKDEKEALASFS